MKSQHLEQHLLATPTSSEGAARVAYPTGPHYDLAPHTSSELDPAVDGSRFFPPSQPSHDPRTTMGMMPMYDPVLNRGTVVFRPFVPLRQPRLAAPVGGPAILRPGPGPPYFTPHPDNNTTCITATRGFTFNYPRKDSLPCGSGSTSVSEPATDHLGGTWQRLPCPAIPRSQASSGVGNNNSDRKTFSEKSHNKSTTLVVLTFPVKLHHIVSDPMNGDIIAWLPNGTAWRILRVQVFEEFILPKYFRSSRLSSFMRQVNGYGFQREVDGIGHHAYSHDLFRRGMPTLALEMQRLRNGDPRPKRRISDYSMLSSPLLPPTSSSQRTPSPLLEVVESSKPKSKPSSKSLPLSVVPNEVVVVTSCAQPGLASIKRMVNNLSTDSLGHLDDILKSNPVSPDYESKQVNPVVNALPKSSPFLESWAGDDDDHDDDYDENRNGNDNGTYDDEFDVQLKLIGSPGTNIRQLEHLHRPRATLISPPAAGVFGGSFGNHVAVYHPEFAVCSPSTTTNADSLADSSSNHRKGRLPDA